MNNFVIGRRISITTYLHTFFPKVVSNLISEYDYYLEGKSNNLTGHSCSVNCFAILPDGRLVSGSDDKSIKIWNMQDGKCEVIFTGHKNEVTCITVLHDGYIVSGSSSGELKLWNPYVNIGTNGNINFCDKSLNTGSRIISISDLPDKQILIVNKMRYSDATLTIWNRYLQDNINKPTIRSQEGVHTVFPDGRIIFRSFNNTLDEITILPDNNITIRKANLNTHNVLPTDSQTKKKSYPQDALNVVHINTYTDGQQNYLVTERSDIMGILIHVWNLSTGKCISGFRVFSMIHSSSSLFSDMIILPDNRIAILDNDTIKIYKLPTGKYNNTFRGTASEIFRTIALLPDGRIVTGSVCGMIKIWS
jgi:WD40 repeat protein